MNSLFLIILSLVTFSCEKNDIPPEGYRVNFPSGNLEIGQTFKITADIYLDSILPSDIKWKINTGRSIELTDSSSYSIGARAIKRGVVSVIFNIPKKNISDTSYITVGYADEIKILTIGNSFSEDAVEKGLRDLFAAGGQNVVIGNMYIAGANFYDHINGITKPMYSFRKIKRNGSREVQANKTLDFAINNEDWDYISFQQSSTLSGNTESYTPLIQLYSWVKDKNLNVDTKYVLHMTWAYATYNRSEEFRAYNFDQKKMYNDILTAYTNAGKLIPVERIIPSGIAIQNSRQYYNDQKITRDGMHLSDFGSVIAASTWYYSFMQKSLLSNRYFVSKLNNQEQLNISNAITSAFNNSLKNNP